jgi:hypothetical protein
MWLERSQLLCQRGCAYDWWDVVLVPACVPACWVCVLVDGSCVMSWGRDRGLVCPAYLGSAVANQHEVSSNAACLCCTRSWHSSLVHTIIV